MPFLLPILIFIIVEIEPEPEPSPVPTLTEPLIVGWPDGETLAFRKP